MAGMTLEHIMNELVSKYAPAWTLTASSVGLRGRGVVELRGALPQTVHFGSARLSLDTGALVFVDEDHRDGGDVEKLRVIVEARELARVLAAAAPTAR